MDRALLSRRLADGWSLAAIGAAAGCDPSTVAYWVNRYGLVSAHSRRREPRGGVDEARLRTLVEQGLSVREIGREVDRSAGSVRYWLRRYGLHTRPVRYTSRQAGPEFLLRECRTHGWTPFRPVGRGHYRCPRCVVERVAARRRRMKEILVAEAGGACELCGYDRCAGALQFHHRDPAQKQFQLGSGGLTRSLERLREEAEKCVLLCANCHAEVEAGLAGADALPG